MEEKKGGSIVHSLFDQCLKWALLKLVLLGNKGKTKRRPLSVQNPQGDKTLVAE